MDFRSTPCVFLGYSPSHHGYRCLDISTERLYIARHVCFNEAQFPFDIPKTTSPPPSKTSPYYSSESPYVIPTTDHPSPSSPRSPISSPSSVSHLSPTSQTSPESSNGQPSPVSTTSIPPPTPPPPPPPPIIRQRPANLCQNPKQRVPYNPSTNHATVLPTTITEPTSFTIANNSPEWHQAMKEEYDALMKNIMWSFVPRASNTNVVDGKWVYRLKRDKNGAITRYKARFVAKGFRQQPCIDFHETFSLVVKSTTIQAILSLAVTNDWPLRQLDIQNAFLHGNLKEQSLYGLKQTPRAWFERLSKALIDLGFKGSKTDPSLFIYSRGDTLLYILVYVDDIIVTGNNKGTIDNIICQLRSAFALKDLGSLNYFLGIEIVPHVSGILLSQKKYILELLQSVGLSNCDPVKISTSSGFFTICYLSQPDIAFVVNKACQYMHASIENHWSAIKRILCYLHGTVEHGILIRRSSGSTLQAFTNVLWKGNPDTSLEAFSDAD
ncbi:putative RNA-directed DNA polymerase [Tanacetum coccineum]